MKFKATRKQIMQGYGRVYGVGDADLQNLLKPLSPVAYNSGAYGWNYDVYSLDVAGYDYAICTGYRSVPGTRIDGAMVDRYERSAKKIWDKPGTYDRQRAAAIRLIARFCAELHKAEFGW